MAATKTKTTNTKKKTTSSGSSANSRARSKTGTRSSASGTRKAGTQRAVKASDVTARQPKTKVLSSEVQGILLMALGIFFACAFYLSAAGIVGTFIRNVCYGLFGAASGVFFIYFLLAGINCFFDKKTGDSLYKWWVLLGLMICSGMIYALALGDTGFVEGGFFGNLNSLYENGINGNGGGILGGFLCKLTVLLIGYMGAWVFSASAVLVLFIILTGISIEGVFRKILNFFRNSGNSIKNRANREVEIEPVLDDYYYDDGEFQESKKTSFLKRVFGKIKTGREKRKEQRNKYDTLNTDYEYEQRHTTDFDDKPVRKSRKGSAKKNSSSIDIELNDKKFIPPPTETKPQRFMFEEDAELSNNLKTSIEDTGISSSQHKFSIDDLPFDIDGITAGTLSEVGDEAGHGFDDVTVPSFLDTSKTGALTNMPKEDGSIPSNDPDDFEPPSEAKLQDKLDPMTKKALDSGVPLDEAVTKGRKMLVEDAEPQTPEQKIAAEIEEKSTVPKLISYKLPPYSLLAEPKPNKKTKAEIKYELEEKANRLLDTLSSFKVEAKIINITQGPSVTRFELQPGFGVKVSKITGLSDDIALSLAAPGVRIEAPIPGKSAIGIEIPNSNPSPVPIREVLDTTEFKRKKSKTTVALGKDISGNCVIADIANFPHILIAGATGSGKSVCINSLITSILYKSKPDEVKMIMVDPKMVELGVYNGIPHLLIPVVTDPKHAAGALNWAVVEMQNRYNLLKDNKVRNLKGYNKLMEEREEPDAKLPEIVIIIDELADLMNVAKSEVEEAINRLAALARAAGMYLVIATQRPSVNVITGVIKANIPSRIAFAVSSQIDSRTIIDSAGAEKLLGKGDMLYSPRGSMKPLRVQGNFVSDSEIEALVDFIKGQYEAEYDEEVIEHIEKEHERVAADLEAGSGSSSSHSGSDGSGGRTDDMFLEAVELVLENGQASVAMFQRKFKMGYQRAAELIDQMEEKKIIGPYEGTKPRQVLITRQEFNEMKYNRSEN